MIKKMFYFWKSHNKKAIFSTSLALLRQFGVKGLYRGIKNKLVGVPLLTGITDYSNGNAGVCFSQSDYDREGMKILNEQQNELSKEEQLDRIAEFTQKPKLSVIMPIYNAPTKWLEIAIASIQNQSYSDWELCVVDDGSKDLRGDALIKELKKSDNRIKYKRLEINEGISNATNIALEMADGKYIALVDQDDELTPDAFFWVVNEINKFPESDLIYSDECKTLNISNPSPCEFYFKPDWSPELLINHMYIGHLTVYRTEIVRAVGGFRKQYDFSQDYDLVLRVTEKTSAIRHIERVLYYWRMLPTSGASGGKDYARISNISALQDAYQRRKIQTITYSGGYANYGFIVTQENPLVSIVIPSDSIENLKKCIEGLTGELTSYKNLEIIPVTNSKTAEEVANCFPHLIYLRICRYDKVYNFSDKCNAGTQIASGKYVVIYNDDVYPFSRDWIERMMEVLQYQGVGAVSPLMIYENQTIQYAGMVCNVPGEVGTSFNGVPFVVKESNPFHHFLMRNVSVLSGACVMLRKDLYDEIGGFDAVNTPDGHSDVDFSFKIMEAGYRCVYTPHAVLIHIGNHSWSAKKKKDKSSIFCIKRWGKYMSRDRYYTKSMRNAYYLNDKSKYEMFIPEKLVNAENENARNILFVSHELSLTGAPILLVDAVEISIMQGDFPVVIAPVDGPLRKKFEELGVTVIIDENVVKNNGFFERFARNFDLVLVNTLVLTEAIESLSDSLPPVIWWIHDGVEVIKAVRHKIPQKLGENIHVYCVSEYSQRLLLQFGKQYSSEILRCAMKDMAVSDTTQDLNTCDKVIFLTIGSIEKRKAQDVLLRAVDNLPSDYRERAQFIIVGNVLQKDMMQMILEYERKYPCINYRKVIPREEILKLYPQSVCVIIPSRDEPTPMIGVESVMFSRTIICSDNTGIGEFIEDHKDGFIFPNEDYKKLASILMEVIDNPETALEMGKKIRSVYDKKYTMSIFKKRYLEIIEQLL